MKSNIYISRKVLNKQDIIDYATDCGFTSMMPADSLHVTVVYCKREVDWNIVDRDQPEMLIIESAEDESERSIHNFDGGACVLEITCPELQERNDALREQGIHSKFPDYRAHITLTYKKPKKMSVKKIKPYMGAIVLGPEIIAPASSGWQEEYKEVKLMKREVIKEARLDDLDIDATYEVFRSSYESTTGQSWTREKFEDRARNWTFYGDATGFVAFREQASGMRKLVGVAGDTSGVVIGLKQLVDEGKPTWGAVSEKIARAAKRFGFIAPHTYLGGALVMRLIMKAIPASVFGGVKPEVNGKGGVTLSYEDLGEQTKFFIANKAYFGELLNNPSFSEHVQNPVVKKFIEAVLK
jgi:hypothetical protein